MTLVRVSLVVGIVLGSIVPLGAQVDLLGSLAGILSQRRLGVEEIPLKWPAIHEQVDHAFGTWGEVQPGRRLRSGLRRRLGQ